MLEVADRGAGLSDEQAAHVFERFYRGDPSRSRDRGGAGLGLAIVAAIVEAHGGAVEVESAPGAGHDVPRPAATGARVSGRRSGVGAASRPARAQPKKASASA